MKETWMQVPKGTRFINLGADLNGEVGFFKVIIIDNIYLAGMVVIDPDGNQLSEIVVENEDVVAMDFSFEEIRFSLQMMVTDFAYEFILSEY